MVAAATTSLARDARRPAQLGLPLLLDPRLDVHALGPVHPGLRRGGQRLLLLHPRRGRQRPGSAADHVRDRRRDRAARADARPPQRLRARAPRADRQRRLRPAPARRVGRAAGLDLPAHEVARRAGRVDLGHPLQAGRGRDPLLERARSRHLGGPRRAAPLHLLQAHVLGRPGPRRAARPPAGGRRASDSMAGCRRRDPCRHQHERRRLARRVRPALRHRRAGRLVPARSRSCASSPPTTSA